MGIAAYSPMTIALSAIEWPGDVGSTHLREYSRHGYPAAGEYDRSTGRLVTFRSEPVNMQPICIVHHAAVSKIFIGF